MKRCTKCGELKPVGEFYKSKAGRDGWRANCKVCDSARRRAWYQANRARAIAKVLSWQRDNERRYKARQREYRTKRSDQEWLGHLKRKFGITVDEYDAFVSAHNGRCAICDGEPTAGRRLHLDHDHDTKALRGMLCVRCNNGLGQFRENPALLQRAADYLESGGFVPGGVADIVDTARARALALKVEKAP